jgi:hypothetical protein
MIFWISSKMIDILIHAVVQCSRIVSMTLGRPTMTTHASNVPVPCIADDTIEGGGGRSPNASQEAPTKMTYFVQSIKLSTVLERILNRVYQPWMRKPASDGLQPHDFHQSFDTIIDLDSQLADFEADVPFFLNWNRSLSSLEQSATPPGMTNIIRLQRNVLHGR